MSGDLQHEHRYLPRRDKSWRCRCGASLIIEPTTMAARVLSEAARAVVFLPFLMETIRFMHGRDQVPRRQ